MIRKCVDLLFWLCISLYRPFGPGFKRWTLRKEINVDIHLSKFIWLKHRERLGSTYRYCITCYQCAPQYASFHVPSLSIWFIIFKFVYSEYELIIFWQALWLTWWSLPRVNRWKKNGYHTYAEKFFEVSVICTQTKSYTEILKDKMFCWLTMLK